MFISFANSMAYCQIWEVKTSGNWCIACSNRVLPLARRFPTFLSTSDSGGDHLLNFILFAVVH